MNKQYDNMHTLVDEYFDDAIKGVQRFVSMESSLNAEEMSADDPFGKNLSEILATFLEYGRSHGFTVKNIANSVGYVECGKGDDLIGILCHLDTVPLGDLSLWKHRPLDAVIDDGRIFGRGTIDDKGPAVASLFAMKALKESGVTLNKRFRLIVGLDEETGSSRCIGKYLETEEVPNYSFSPDSNFPLINGEKGILRFNITKKQIPQVGSMKIVSIKAGDRLNVVPDSASAELTGDGYIIETVISPLLSDSLTMHKVIGGGFILESKGKSAHAMEPDKGVNAIQILLSALVAIDYGKNPMGGYLNKVQNLVKKELNGESLGISCADEVSGKLTCNLAVIECNGDECTLKFDVRYPVQADFEDIMKRLKASVASIGAELEVPLHKKPLYIPEDNRFVQLLLGSYNKITGDNGKPYSIGGGTYCRFLPNAVSFGPVLPGEEELLHQPNESISINSLRTVIHIYAEALFRLNSMTGDQK